MITVTLYTRAGCHLCEDTLQDLDRLRAEIPHKVVVVDIDTDPKLQKMYGMEVPVVEAGPFRLKAPIAIQDLKVTLSAARDRERHIEMVEKSPKLTQVRSTGSWTTSDAINLALSRHYMLFFNTIVFIYLGLSFLAPVLASAGAEKPANLLYRAYSFVCHQLAYRSFFIGGDQIVYPREAAGMEGIDTYEEATGLSEDGSARAVFAAREFIGNDQVGYKVALCQRDVAIYGSILLFGVVFSLSGFRLKPIPWWLWLMVAIVPIALDGFSQLLSQPPLSLLPYRESTPMLRVLTGFLFGFFTAWFGYPMVEESMADTRKVMTAKWERLNPAG